MMINSLISVMIYAGTQRTGISAKKVLINGIPFRYQYLYLYHQTETIESVIEHLRLYPLEVLAFQALHL